jgi:Ca2+-binding RTX toxin-like protein
MATFNAVNATGPIRFDTFNVASLLAGSTITDEPTIFTRGTDPDNATTFFGTGFNYSGGLFNAGTINSISSVASGQTQYTIGGLAMPVAQFRAFASAGNSQGFLAAAFAGDDTLTGSAFADHLRGYAGNDMLLNNPGNKDNDTLDGGAGVDTMDGADGDDLYIVDDAADSIIDSSGFDTVKSSASSYDLATGVERLILTGKGDLNGGGDALANQIFGTIGANVLLGRDGNDLLEGGAGNDSLDGGGQNDTMIGGAGIDTMTGGDGDDLFIVDNAKDALSDSSGIDSVQSTVSYILSGDIDNLFLTGAGALNGTGNDIANQIAGTSGANKLLGLADNDTLEGGGGNDNLDGGLGDDVMRGGAGNDTYFVDSTNDQVTESTAGKAGGIDIVFSAADITLGANIENLTLIGSKSLVAQGNDLNNVITAKNDNPGINGLSGGAGNDTIIGSAGKDLLQGGAGADKLSGGAGDDTYTIDDTDKIAEALSASKGGGNDSVNYEGTIGYTLGANLENLGLSGSAGAAFATGNGLDNQITGNADANTLDGRAGADILTGGGGDDIYVVDNALDIVNEFNISGTGIDTVRSSVDFDLTPGPTTLGDVENLVLLGKAVTGTGNNLDNKITGNAGKNSLNGGAGNDTLDGGAGADSLQGGGGNDTLDGGAGNDTLDGGEDGDVYMIDSKLDTIIDTGTSGVDLILTSKISLDISALPAIENVQLSGKLALNVTGNGASNSLIGNDGANKLSGLGGADDIIGGKGNDTLDGGVGPDAMFGGDGNDTYFVDFFTGSPLGGDQVFEGADGGLDTIISTASDLILFNNVENLVLASGVGIGGGTGNDLANVLTGNENSNLLFGGAGNDTIIGGAGGDTLIGGDDNDSIDGGTGNDAIAGGSGNDTITGGAGDDTLNGENGDDVINVTAGNDVVALGLTTTDGHDLVIGFDGNAAGGQDVLSLEALFAAIPPADRAAHVQIIDHGATVDVRVDADNNLANGYELTATLQTKDAVTIGEDVLLGAP